MRKELMQTGTQEVLKWMGIGAFLFGVCMLGSKMFSNYFPKFISSAQTSKRSAETPGQKDTGNEYSKYYFDRFLQINKIVEKIGNRPTVEGIYLQSLILAEDEFYKYTKEMRKRRRLVRKVNEEQYINIVLDYESQVQELMFRCRLELLDAFSVSQNQFQKMQDQYDILEGLKSLKQTAQKKLRFCLKKRKNKNVMTSEKMGLIIDEQIGFVENKMYGRLRKKMQQQMFLTQEQILKVSMALLDDVLYQKYGYEREDFEIKLQLHEEMKQESNFFLQKMAADISEFNFDSLESGGEEETITKGEVTRSQKTITRASQNEENSFDL